MPKTPYDKAREKFKKSLVIDPGHRPAREALELLKVLGAKKT
jgi:hypothetical protein